MTYFFNTDEDGKRVGERVYLSVKLAIGAAKRAAKARAKRELATIGGAVVYVMESGDIYDRRVATVTRSEVSYLR